MSDAPAPPDPGGMQFDRAEPKAPDARQVACFACKNAIAEAYYTVNSQIVCDPCRGLIEAGLAGGSGGRRFLKALLFGLGAGAAGALLYFLILKLFNIHLSLISILVGYLVGTAVRKGSEGRGGRGYQILAVFLTYSAIVTAFIPDLLGSDPKHPAPKVERSTSAEGEDAPKPGADKPAPGCLGSALRVVLICAVAYMVPWLGGTDNFILWIIIFFALWEAWRLTRHLPLAFSGPFRVAGQPPPPAPEGPPVA